MNSLRHLLETFCERFAPRGVAFVGSSRFAMSLGRPPAACGFICDATAGFSQYHVEDSDMSVYVSSFGWGKFLIAQFPFQEEYPPPAREWLAFVRLAAAVTRAIESPDADEDEGAAGIAVRRPSPTPLRTRTAEAPVNDESSA